MELLLIMPAAVEEEDGMLLDLLEDLVVEVLVLLVLREPGQMELLTLVVVLEDLEAPLTVEPDKVDQEDLVLLLLLINLDNK
jgi:hypothetical protein